MPLHLGQCSGAILSLSKKQTVTADSSTIAEFLTTHSVCKKILWAQNFLKELNFISCIPTTVYQDNKSSTRLILHKGKLGRTKHIALRYNIIR